MAKPLQADEKGIIEETFILGIPVSQIATGIKRSPITITNHIESCDPALQKPVNKTAAYSLTFKRYMKLLNSYQEDPQLRSIIETYLNLDEVKSFVESSLILMDAYVVADIKQDYMMPYYRLVHAIFGQKAIFGFEQFVADHKRSTQKRVDEAIVSYARSRPSDKYPIPTDTHGFEKSIALFLRDKLPYTTTPFISLDSDELLKLKVPLMLRMLSEREREVLEMRFGLNGKDPMTLEEIGKIRRVNRERIRQIEAKALRRCKVPRFSSELRPILDGYAGRKKVHDLLHNHRFSKTYLSFEPVSLFGEFPADILKILEENEVSSAWDIVSSKSLEQLFSEEQIITIATKIAEYDPHNKTGFKSPDFVLERDRLKGENDPAMTKYSLRIDSLELSVRSEQSLRNNQVIFVGELVQKTESVLLRMPNFGRKSLNEVKEVLAEMGLHLGMAIDDLVKDAIDRLSGT